MLINKYIDQSTSFQPIYHTLKSLREKYRKFIRYRVRGPIRYQLDLASTHLNKVGIPITSASRVIRALIVSDGKIYTTEAQFDPIFAYHQVLKQHFGFIFKSIQIESALRYPQIFDQFDVIFVKLSFTTPTIKAQQILKSIHVAKGSAKLIYFDGDDDLCVQWPEIFPYVDLYVKFFLFADLEQYGKIFVGKSNLTDYVASRWGYSFANSAVPMSKPLEPEQRSKLFLGNNYASNNMMFKLYQKLPHDQRIPKTNDIICSLSLTNRLVPDSWKRYMREDAVLKLQAFSSQYQVLVNTGKKIPEEAYHRNMLSSKLCVSPFGCGELTYRDFETVFCRCLLVKPDMAHVQSTPDIYIPYESYVPVKWDFSDLEEKCVYYLEHDEEREKITERAYQILIDYYRNDTFLDNFAKLLERVNLI